MSCVILQAADLIWNQSPGEKPAHTRWTVSCIRFPRHHSDQEAAKQFKAKMCAFFSKVSNSLWICDVIESIGFFVALREKLTQINETLLRKGRKNLSKPLLTEAGDPGGKLSDTKIIYLLNEWIQAEAKQLAYYTFEASKAQCNLQ